MVDSFSKETRSAVMSAIRSTSNKTTEMKMLYFLKKAKITGWRRHLKLTGRPDFTWRKKKVALFVDGCFWHGCKKCYKAPASNTPYWKQKIFRNRARDKQINKALRSSGWTVMRVKECQLRSPNYMKKRLQKIRCLVL